MVLRIFRVKFSHFYFNGLEVLAHKVVTEKIAVAAQNRLIGPSGEHFLFIAVLKWDLNVTETYADIGIAAQNGLSITHRRTK